MVKLLETGYLSNSHGMSPISEINKHERRKGNEFANILISSGACSLATAVLLSPLDIALFKLIARTTRHSGVISSQKVTLKQSFDSVFKTNTLQGSGGAYQALGLVFVSTFIRYFFMTLSLNTHLNS